MNSDPVHVSQIRWRKVFPLFHLTDSLSLAFRFRTLIPAAVMVLVLTALSGMHGREFPRLPFVFSDWLAPESDMLPVASRVPVLVRGLHIFEFPDNLSLLPFIAQLIVGGIFSVAIAHSTGAAFCRNQRVGVFNSLRYSVRRVLTLVCVVLLVVAISTVLVWAGVLAEKVLSWPLTEKGNFELRTIVQIWCGLIAFAAIVVTALSTSAIAIEDCNAADAVSRSINYLWSHFLFTVSGFSVLAAIHVVLQLILLQLHRFGPYVRTPEGANLFWLSRCPEIFEVNLMTIGVAILYLLLRMREDATKLDEMPALAE